MNHSSTCEIVKIIKHYFPQQIAIGLNGEPVYAQVNRDTKKRIRTTTASTVSIGNGSVATGLTASISEHEQIHGPGGSGGVRQSNSRGNMVEEKISRTSANAWI